jgi:cytochrome c5
VCSSTVTLQATANETAHGERAAAHRYIEPVGAQPARERWNEQLQRSRQHGHTHSPFSSTCTRCNARMKPTTPFVAARFQGAKRSSTPCLATAHL